MCEKPHVCRVSAAIKSRHAGLNRLQCAVLPFLWCISDRPQLRAQNPEGLCTTQRQPAQGRPDRCALTTPTCVYLWAGVAIEFVIPLCNAMTGIHKNGLLRNFVVGDCAVVFVKLLNVALSGCVNGILLPLLWLWEMGTVRYCVTRRTQRRINLKCLVFCSAEENSLVLLRRTGCQWSACVTILTRLLMHTRCSIILSLHDLKKN